MCVRCNNIRTRVYGPTRCARDGILIVIGLRKFIQSSTVDLFEHLGAEIVLLLRYYYYYYYYYKRERVNVKKKKSIGNRNNTVRRLTWSLRRRCCHRRRRRNRRRGEEGGLLILGQTLSVYTRIHTRADWYENKYVGHWASCVYISLARARARLPPSPYIQPSAHPPSHQHTTAVVVDGNNVCVCVCVVVRRRSARPFHE